MNVDFLTPGEKIKKLRIELGVKQSQLTEAGITRNFISMLETNKRGLNQDTAEKILEVFQKIATDKGSILDIDLASLLESTQLQVEKYCRTLLDDENHNIDEVIDLSKKYGLDELLYTSYMEKANKLYDETNYLNAFIYYLDALDLSRLLKEKPSQAFLYNKLGKCKMVMLLSAEAQTYFQKALDYSILENDINTRKNSTYNLAYCCMMSEDYFTALEIIQRYLAMCDVQINQNEVVNATILKSTCYMNLSQYKDAKDCLFDAIGIIKDENSPSLGYIYSNLGMTYARLQEYTEAFYYFDKSEAVRKKSDIKNISHTLVEKSTAYIEKGDYTMAEKNLEEAVKLAANCNDKSFELRGYKLLKQIYEKSGNQTKLVDTYNNIIHLLRTTNNDKELLENSISLSLLYLKNGNIDSCQKVLSESSSTVMVE